MAAKQLITCIAQIIWLWQLIGVECATNSAYSEFTVEIASCEWFPTTRQCGYLGMDFHSYRRCSFGRKAVICRKMMEIDNKYDRNNNTLHIVSYNVKQLPYLLYRSGGTERTCRIPEALLRRIPTIDVIVFEELFFKGCLKGRIDMARLLKPFGFKWTYQPLDETVRLPQFVGAGVMIASRWPIVAVANQVFKAKKKLSSDVLAKKGVVYAAIQKGSSKYHIFGSHFQASRGAKKAMVRLQQAQELFNFYAKQRIPKNEAVLFTGDFNQALRYDTNYINRIFEILRARIPQVIGSLRYTFDHTNPLVSNNAPDEWLDYVLWSREHRSPKRATLKAVNLLASRPFEYCSLSPFIFKYVTPSSVKCLKRKTTRYLSDHYLVYGILHF